MPPACVYTCYFFWRDYFTLAVTLVFICVSGVTLFLLGVNFLSGVSFMPAPGYGPYLLLIIV